MDYSKFTRQNERCKFQKEVFCKDMPCRCGNNPDKKLTTPFALKLLEETKKFNSTPAPISYNKEF